MATTSSKAVAARRTDKLETLVARIRDAGGEARALALDVTDAASVARCLDELADWGVPDVVINNAGVTVTKPLLQQSEADYDTVLDANLKGAWLVGTEAARRMVAAADGAREDDDAQHPDGGDRRQPGAQTYRLAARRCSLARRLLARAALGS